MSKKVNWQKVGKGAVIVLILGYILSFVTMFANASQMRICSTCHVTIADGDRLRFVDEKDVLDLLAEDDLNPLGVRSEFVSTAEMEKSLESKSRIKDAECYKTPKGSVNVVVLQREPVMRVMTPNANYYIDSEGGEMALTDRFAAYVPIVTGNVKKCFAKGELYEFALFLHNDKFWNAFVEQIDVDSRQELTIVPRVGNQIIRLGSLEDYKKKLNKLYSIYQNGFNKMGWNMYKEINLKYDGQVVCTKK